MLKREIYDKYMKDDLKKCCSERAWNNWKLYNRETNQIDRYSVLVPDVSRIFRRPYDISSEDYPILNSLFNRKRKTNL